MVERPASVVKELVENSIDAGATRIDIDIEKGGSKLIRVRDNGKGIAKDELELALSRHATSKIKTLDDLEAILSLGFRGEALASISSVSRLTLTSRTPTQEQAWSAYSEGRDMKVKLQPTAHPAGSTVEVLDLFFNTPARRKFLRTEKTEFSHIEELLKRIALSRFDITINLRHNGKMIKQYRAAKTEAQWEKRVQSVCGAQFARHMLRVQLEHQGLKLSGWITTPEGARLQSDLQYCYVNGRMMKDKLINHAIRQSYELTLRPEQYAAYVLFIEVDPHQVDVNVHPAKHEVRFHQARLVHDFIYQALVDALGQTQQAEQPRRESAYAVPVPDAPEKPEQPQTWSTERGASQPTTQYRQEREANAIRHASSYPSSEGHTRVQAVHETPVSTAKPSIKPQPKREEPKQVTAEETRIYQELLTVEPEIERPKASKLGKALSIVDKRYLLVQSDAGPALVNLARAEVLKLQLQLSVEERNLVPQPLLIPLALRVNEAEVQKLKQYSAILQRFAIQLMFKSNAKVMVMAVPQPLRNQNLQHLFASLLLLLQGESQLEAQTLSNWIAEQLADADKEYSLSEAVQLMSELEGASAQRLDLNDNRFIQTVDFSTHIKAFTNER
ncbi:DNA mismatch repair protein mutL [Vibrio ishigakensis]|uniref:DNA mismatch repair protein MutL n=1 Tax=Vibrio ishigakensis TaxID=1481914 RepID=A0A0B8QXE9_9VIBR|nr:DNA mismatch repair protein mutL [Vibrio ishigakensis]